MSYCWEKLCRKYVSGNTLDGIAYNGAGECDFVYQRNDSVIQLIQASWDMSDENNRERELTGIIEASGACRCDNLFIITKGEERVISREGKRINVVPAWKWLS